MQQNENEIKKKKELFDLSLIDNITQMIPPVSLK